MKEIKNMFSTIILVGGLGSRFSSLKEPPKQLSKLNNEFILIHIINQFNKFGLNHFIFPLGYKKNYFSKFFKSKKNILKYNFNILNNNLKNNTIDKDKINITFFYAGTKTTKISRIYKSLKYLISEDFIVAYGDDLSNINMNKLIKKYHAYKKKKAVTTIFKKKSQYGHVIIGNNGFVEKFEEKPPLQYPINIGNYVFPTNLVKKYKTKGDLENFFLPSLSKKSLLQSYEHKGYFYSINDKKELNIAKKKLLKNK